MIFETQSESVAGKVVATNVVDVQVWSGQKRGKLPPCPSPAYAIGRTNGKNQGKSVDFSHIVSKLNEINFGTPINCSVRKSYSNVYCFIEPLFLYHAISDDDWKFIKALISSVSYFGVLVVRYSRGKSVLSTNIDSGLTNRECTFKFDEIIVNVMKKCWSFSLYTGCPKKTENYWNHQ